MSIAIRPLLNVEDFMKSFELRRVNNLCDKPGMNLAVDTDAHELDIYDLRSFHFGAFGNGRLYGMCRMVNGVVSKYQQSENNARIIKQFMNRDSSEEKLQLLEFVSGRGREIVLNYLDELEKNEKEYNEISRLIHLAESGEKYLTNHLICYAWAFDRFYGIDHCFFDAIEEHCTYYERFFNCKRVFPELQIRPLSQREPFFVMQATTVELSEKMNAIVDRIVARFQEHGGPCEVSLNELKWVRELR